VRICREWARQDRAFDYYENGDYAAWDVFISSCLYYPECLLHRRYCKYPKISVDITPILIKLD